MTRIHARALAFFVMLGLAAAAATACGGDSKAAPEIDPGDGGAYAPTVTAADFRPRITNPYLPFVTGARWAYEADDGSERIEVEVLAETRQIMGIAATVVRDRVWEDGELVEDTFDWYAEDTNGNVWYLGEDSTEYEDGKATSTAGSWEAGVDGAKPGIIMLASPAIGRAYRQEYYKGEAEDLAEVVRLDGSETVPFGAYDRLVVIKEWTPLEPKTVEEKYYAAGIGLVMEKKLTGSKGRVALVSYEPGR